MAEGSGTEGKLNAATEQDLNIKGSEDVKLGVPERRWVEERSVLEMG